MATLVVLQGPDKGRTLKAADEHVVIGRGSDQMSLTDQSVSRRHAELRRSDGNWELVDLRSANGTYVNGVRVEKPLRLKHGDQIRLGGTLLVYTGDETTQQLVGAGIPNDMVTLDVASGSDNAAIMASAVSSDDSVVLAAPEASYAVKAWNVMRELWEVIGTPLLSDQLLARVLDVIFTEVEVDRGVILMCDAQSEDLIPEVVRFHNRPAEGATNGNAIVASRTIINHVLTSRAGVLCSNVVADKRFASGKSVQNLGMRSIICCPLVARDQVLGVIHLDCSVTRHTYNEHELKLITAIGYQAGLAIENARLVQAHLQRERLAVAGETVAYLSHYIKNLLQGMRSGADVLERGLKKKDMAVTTQGWGIVARNLDKSYNLMLNMLAFSKAREPRFEMLHVNKVVEDVVALVQKQADDAKIVLLPDLEDSLPPIPLDYDGLHQVILNLLTNALEAVKPGQGVVNVRTTLDVPRRCVVLSVTDNGPGIPTEGRRRIFEPFFSTKGHGGTGLGLAVARKIIGEMNGEIELFDPPDGGAEFRIRLPLSQPQPPSGSDTLAPPG